MMTSQEKPSDVFICRREAQTKAAWRRVLLQYNSGNLMTEKVALAQRETSAGAFS